MDFLASRGLFFYKHRLRESDNIPERVAIPAVRILLLFLPRVPPEWALFIFHRHQLRWNKYINFVEFSCRSVTLIALCYEGIFSALEEQRIFFTPKSLYFDGTLTNQKLSCSYAHRGGDRQQAWELCRCPLFQPWRG